MAGGQVAGALRAGSALLGGQPAAELPAGLLRGVQHALGGGAALGEHAYPVVHVRKGGQPVAAPHAAGHLAAQLMPVWARLARARQPQDSHPVMPAASGRSQ